MKEFKKCVLEQLELHPSMQPRDLCKLCYQAARGGEHLLSDLAAARQYLLDEFAAVEADDSLPLSEPISSLYCRVNLGAWKAAGCKADDLFTIFAAGGAAAEEVEPYLTAAEEVWLQSGRDAAVLAAFYERYQAAGCPSLHHSEEYRQAERPAYRVCKSAVLPNRDIPANIKK